MNRASLLLWSSAVSVAASPAWAQTAPQPSPTPPAIAQPGMNLGDTSFLDAGGSPGWTLELLGSASVAHRANDASGQRLPGDHDQATGVVNIHPLYTTGIKLFGGALGFDILVPTAIVGVNLPGPPAHRPTIAGVGDISVGTYLQWSGMHSAGRPLDVRAALSVTTPTGRYSRDRAVNIGNNAWQITPYVSATWQLTKAWEISARVTYDWIGRNAAPNTGAAIRSAQAGDQLGINLATSYALSPKIRLGVSGFLYRQLSDTRSDGLAVPGSRQRLYGVGPGMVWNAGPKSVVLFNVYDELGAENRSEGVSMRLRLLQSL